MALVVPAWTRELHRHIAKTISTNGTFDTEQKSQCNIRRIRDKKMYRGKVFVVGPGFEEPSSRMDPLVEATDEVLSGAGGGSRARTVLKHESVSWPGPDLVYIYRLTFLEAPPQVIPNPL